MVGPTSVVATHVPLSSRKLGPCQFASFRQHGHAKPAHVLDIATNTNHFKADGFRLSKLTTDFDIVAPSADWPTAVLVNKTH